MRKLLIISFLLCALNLAAQPRLKQEEMYIGVHAGAIATMVSFAPEIEQNALQPFLGANGGFVFRYAGHKVCGLQVELNYMQRGWYEVQTGYKRTIDYIELPFLTHLSFGKKCRGFVNLGPQIGYAIRDVLPTAPLSPSDKYYPSAQYLHIDNRFDWGIAGGLGVLYRTPKAGVYQLEARFNYSFGNLYANSKFDAFSKSFPMSLSLNLAWLWPLR